MKVNSFFYINKTEGGEKMNYIGLQWERERLKTVYPFFVEDIDKSIYKNNGNYNILIEGDNFYSLTLLKSFYKNKIDVIYIDPPYNTGNINFVYNDKFVDNKYKYKHSFWLNFMYQRLLIAKELLKDEGFIFISIDDNEMAHLKLLCDEIFGEENFVVNFNWIMSTTDIEETSNEEKIKTLGANLGEIRHSHEYILCYKKSHKAKLKLLPAESEYIHSRITNRANKLSQITLKKGLLCENKITKTFKGIIGGKSEPIKILNEEGMIIEDGILMNDVLLEGNFRNPQYIEKFFNNEEVYDNKGQKLISIYLRKNGIPYTIKKSNGKIPTSIFSGYGDTSKWRKNLIEILGKEVFEYPKPYPLIQKIIRMATDNKEAIILDFFAGSGTTGHAVLELNKEDGGNRTFILCQNNDNNICREITYERIKRLIEGYKVKNKDIQGIEANLKYYIYSHEFNNENEYKEYIKKLGGL